MNIRLAQTGDLARLNELYVIARKYMKESGNPNQWKDNRPSQAAILNDLEKKQSYVIEEDGIIYGVFAFIPGDDPTYHEIEGAWMNDEEYAVLHRIASSQQKKGIFKIAMDFCESRAENMRIDTHEDNLTMQHLLKKRGYTYCGIIYTDDGTPRLAYQKKMSSTK